MDRQRTSFDLEPNPFEHSFASTGSSESSIKSHVLSSRNSPSLSQNPRKAKKVKADATTAPITSATISTTQQQPPLNVTLAAGVLKVNSSDGVSGTISPKSMATQGLLSTPGTPGANQLWNSLLNVTTTTTSGHNSSAHPEPTTKTASSSMSIDDSAKPRPVPIHATRKASNLPHLENLSKTVMTPGPRSGFTPGAAFPIFNAQNLTPSELGPMTPGLSCLLGLGNLPHHTTQPHLAASQAVSSEPREANLSLKSDTTDVHVKPETTVMKRDHKIPTILPEPVPKEKKRRVGGPTTRNVPTAPEEILNASERDASAQSDSVMISNLRKSESVSNGNLPDERDDNKDRGKRISALERNRLAASKCRHRKKAQMQKMEEELSFFSMGFHELSAQVSQLRDQVITLKGIIVGHKDCGNFASSVGGYDQLNAIIHQANMLTQAPPPTAAFQGQISLPSQHISTVMPSTVPTALNAPVNPRFGQEMQPPRHYAQPYPSHIQSITPPQQFQSGLPQSGSLPHHEMSQHQQQQNFHRSLAPPTETPHYAQPREVPQQHRTRGRDPQMNGENVAAQSAHHSRTSSDQGVTLNFGLHGSPRDFQQVPGPRTIHMNNDLRTAKSRVKAEENRYDKDREVPHRVNQSMTNLSELSTTQKMQHGSDVKAVNSMIDMRK